MKLILSIVVTLLFTIQTSAQNSTAVYKEDFQTRAKKKLNLSRGSWSTAIQWSCIPEQTYYFWVTPQTKYKQMPFAGHLTLQIVAPDNTVAFEGDVGIKWTPKRAGNYTFLFLFYQDKIYGDQASTTSYVSGLQIAWELYSQTRQDLIGKPIQSAEAKIELPTLAKNPPNTKADNAGRNGFVEVQNAQGTKIYQFYKDGKLVHDNLTLINNLYCVNGDCASGQGQILYKNGEFYVGDVKGGNADGIGRMQFFNGATYEGSVQKNLLNGKGKMIWSIGTSYEGDWLMGKKTGYGVFKWPSGDSYRGQWRDDLIQGKGVYANNNGSSYDGDWVADKYEGWGTFTWGEGPIKGDKYIGPHKNGKQSGKGIYYTVSGNTFQGDFSEGRFLGKGIYTFANGDKYTSDAWDGFSFDNGVYIRVGSKDEISGKLKDKQFTPVGVLPVVKPQGGADFCNVLGRLISSVESGPYSLNEFLADAKTGSRYSKDAQGMPTTFNSQLALPGVIEFLIFKNPDQTQMHSIMSQNSLKMYVITDFENMKKKVEACFNTLQLQYTKYVNGPQNTYYEIGNASVSVRYSSHSEGGYIVYMGIAYLPLVKSTYR